MSPSVGSLYEGEIKDYATLGGYILFRKPDSMRVVGTDPVMHMMVFDMVSAGDQFRMYLPHKDQFIEGANSTTLAPQSNSRISHFLADFSAESSRRRRSFGRGYNRRQRVLHSFATPARSGGAAGSLRLFRPPSIGNREQETFWACPLS
jgi:hypothetical protein